MPSRGEPGSASVAVRLFGTERVDPPMRPLAAGPLSLDLDNGALRYIRIGGVEVLRGIAFLVRDENWGTLPQTIEDMAVEENADGFSVRYRAVCADAVRRLSIEATIVGRSDGRLSFDVTAEPQTDILTNRTGFVVLHPLRGVVGRPVTVLHVDGREERSLFPERIDPSCPFRDIRALSHEIAPGLTATCRMEGDSFEMEDHRNWSDASYKTYVRPLSRPWPYSLRKGEPLRQSVSLQIDGPLLPAASHASDEPIAIRLDGAGGRLPAIGLGVPQEEAEAALENIALLKRLVPRSLVCRVDLRGDGWRPALDAYRALGEATGAEIALEIVTTGSLDPEAELGEVATACDASGLRPAAVSVFPAQDLVSRQPGAEWPAMPSFAETYAAARAAFPAARLGGGMATYFTELNRKPPPAELLDFVTFTSCPIVHAADDRSVMETNEALPYQIASAQALVGARTPLRIGPSQLGCRENPYGAGTALNPDNGRVCLSALDPRQRGIFNAAWMIAYVAACAKDGVEAIALGAPSGPFGHIHRRAAQAQPVFDDAADAVVYPSFHVVADLAKAAGAELLGARSARPETVAALGLRSAGRTILWIANLTASPVTVDLPAQVAREGHAATIDAETFDALVRSADALETTARPLPEGPLPLAPYAVVRITS